MGECEENTWILEAKTGWRWPFHSPEAMSRTTRMNSAHEDRKITQEMTHINEAKVLIAGTGRTGSNDVEAGRSPSLLIQ